MPFSVVKFAKPTPKFLNVTNCLCALPLTSAQRRTLFCVGVVINIGSVHSTCAVSGGSGYVRTVTIGGDTFSVLGGFFLSGLKFTLSAMIFELMNALKPLMMFFFLGITPAVEDITQSQCLRYSLPLA